MIILFLILYLNVKKLKLIKNESHNLLTIKVINFFNCSKSAFNINLQNVIIDLIKYENSVENAVYNREALVIFIKNIFLFFLYFLICY